MKLKILGLMLVMFSSIVIVPGVLGLEIVLNESGENIGDTFVTPVNPIGNYGSGTGLYFENGTEVVLVKFNMSKVPIDSYITDAQLIFSFSKKTSPYPKTITAYGCGDNWSEDTVTYNTRPALGLELDSYTLPDSSDFGPYDFNVTTHTKGKEKNENVTICLNMTEANEIEFISKEWLTYKDGPKLNITYINRSNIQLTSCDTLDIENATYYLQNDIGSGSANCMDITANGVTLDCQGKQITLGILPDYAIRIARDTNENTDITVRDCQLSYTDEANIYVNNANRNVFANITLNTIVDTGIYLTNSHNNSVINSYLGESAPGTGSRIRAVYVYNSSGTTINDTVIGNDLQHAVSFSPETDSNCVANLNNVTTTDGGYVEFYSSAVTIEDRSNVSEITLCNADDSLLTNITFVDNIGTLDYYGIHVIYSDNVNMSNITIQDHNNQIFLEYSNNVKLSDSILNSSYTSLSISYSNYSVILDNNFTYASTKSINYLYSNYGNVTDNIFIKTTGASSEVINNLHSNNTIFNNFFNVSDDSYGNVIDGTFSLPPINITRIIDTRIFSLGTYIGGNYWATYAGDGKSETCADTNYDGFCDTSLSLGTGTDYEPYSNNFDGTVPLYSDNTLNDSSPRYNATVNFSVTLTDNKELDLAKFSHNMSGTWVNVTNITLSGTEQNISYAFQVNVTKGVKVCGQFWFNDSAYYNNFNITNQSCFTVINTPPSVQSVTINPSPAESTDNLNITNTTSDNDNDSITDWYIRWYNDTVMVPSLENLTMIGAGNTTDDQDWVAEVSAYDGEEWSAFTNSSILTIADTVAPVLNNASLSSTSGVNDAAFTIFVNVTEANEVSIIRVEIIDPNDGYTNYTMSLQSSSRYNRTYTPSTDGTYQFNFYARDGSGNWGNLSSNLTYIEDSYTPSGGGGGSKTIQEVPTNITAEDIPGICGNDLCEDGETPLNCPNDCVPDILNLEKIFCLPLLSCGNWETEWFINGVFLGVVGFILYVSAKKKKLNGRYR